MKSSVLIVDDHPENLQVLDALLGTKYRLVRAHSGLEALNLLEENSVDLILLDIEMPGMDGYQTAQRIKLMEHCRNIPIIFISGIFTEDPEIRKGYAYGAIDYFTKPFDPAILRRKVAIYTSLRQKDALLEEMEERVRELEELLHKNRLPQDEIENQSTSFGA
jgi:response regulator RpfG family c-di-GMP phosphodiesterase